MKKGYDLDSYLSYKEDADLGQVATSTHVIEEMLDKLPKQFWKSETTTFLDPCFGYGTFLKAIVKRLVKAGHSKENILSRVYGVEKDLRLFNAVKNSTCLKNIYNEDSLTKNWKMKFDVVIGNPPYQYPTNKRWKLWIDFIDKGVSVLNKDSVLFMVTPTAWIDNVGNDIKKAHELIKSNNLILVNKDVNRYFPGVGEDIGYLMLKNNKYEGKTVVIDNDSAQSIDFYNQPKSVLATITDKVFGYSQEKMQCSQIGNTSKKHENCRFERDEKHTLECIHTASQTLWYEPTEKMLNAAKGYKVIVNMSGYYYKPGHDQYIRISNKAFAGKGTMAVYAKNLDHAKKIKTLLECKLFRFVVDNNKTSGFNFYTFCNLPKITDDLLNLAGNDKLIYKFFKLTEEEVLYIENF